MEKRTPKIRKNVAVYSDVTQSAIINGIGVKMSPEQFKSSWENWNGSEPPSGHYLDK